jgi:hypothetical protein
LPDEEKRSIYNLDNALGIIRTRLASLDIAEQCRRADAVCAPTDSGTRATVRYLNQPYEVRLPEAEVTPASGAPEIPLREQILILHYLANAGGARPTGRLITYRDLPSGVVYFPTFSKRTTDQLAMRFGRDAAGLVRAAEGAGGRTGDMGDATVIIDVFPRVPITLVLWAGDDEFPARMNVLFDANITDYMEPEDVTVAYEVLTWRLIRSARS